MKTQDFCHTAMYGKVEDEHCKVSSQTLKKIGLDCTDFPGAGLTRNEKTCIIPLPTLGNLTPVIKEKIAKHYISTIKASEKALYMEERGIQESLELADEKRQRFGLPTLEDERLFNESSSSIIIKEQEGIALIRFDDPYSPASEAPVIYQIRGEGGDKIWNSHITYTAEFDSPLESSEWVRKFAEEKFAEILKKREKKSEM